jgi:hypothetical protein
MVAFTESELYRIVDNLFQMYASDCRKDAEEGLERIIENKESIIENQRDKLVHMIWGCD